MGDDASRWTRYRRVLEGTPLPAALVDLDALDRNVEALLGPVRARGKRLRLATKSVRCLGLVRHLLERGGGAIRGLMTYTASETAFLAGEGFADLLLAYPTAQASDAGLLARANQGGATARVAVDAPEHLALLDAAARAAGTTIPVVIDVDVAYRPPGTRAHLGVRRSPLRAAADVVAFAERIADHPGLTFGGLLAYEAQIAGLTDAGPFAGLAGMANPARRAMKRLARGQLARSREALQRALEQHGLAPPLFNGGGTGSLAWACEEAVLSEVTAGSGFLDSLLFDQYRGLRLEPALYFALQVVRRPTAGMVTCHGGGYVASGDGGPDRLPRPALPPGCRLQPLEGAGEVQTPVVLPRGVDLRLGDPIFFRPAKSGELAEHFDAYHLVRGDATIARAPTYRGQGRCFLG